MRRILLGHSLPGPAGRRHTPAWIPRNNESAAVR
ncbi:protein of unknown function [Streptomyces murinus]